MIYDRVGVTPAFVALTGGIVMMIYSYDEPSEALRVVDWSTVFFLAGLFTMINGMEHSGVIDQISNSMLGVAGSRPQFLTITVMWLSAFPSSIVDNIPMTATFAPIIESWVSEGLCKDIWWGLVIGANLGGNLTPIGSPSNILVLAVSEREGTPISFMTFFKHGFPITVIHLLISTVYLYLLYIVP
jgi:Na+/H+ antiporter NhaD/arsenite permease-like protein